MVQIHEEAKKEEEGKRKRGLKKLGGDKKEKMNKLVSILLVCVMLASVLVSEAAAQSVEGAVTSAKVDGQNLHKQVSFEIGLKQLKISKIDDFDWVDLPKCSRISALGHPALPIKSIVVKLPRNTKVIGVNPTETTSITVPDKYRIAPALQPHPISGPRKGKLSESLREIYESKVPYPEKLFDVYNSKGRDYNYVIIYTYPLRWTPAEGKLELTTKATFDVEYTTEAGSSATGEVQPLDGGPVEIIITAPAYVDAATTLANWRTSNGIKTTVYTTDLICADPTKDDPQEIRNFIYEEFTATDPPTLEYVLLFGDVNTGDPEVADDYSVPTRLAWIPDGYDDEGAENTDGTLVPTDYYYECLDGAWDPSGDGRYADLANDVGVDFIPEVSVGRLSVNAETVNQVVNKIIQYEQNRDPTWFEKMALAGTNIFDGAEGLKDYVGDILQHNFTFTKLYDTQGTLSPMAISDNINSGSGALNFAGHGNYGLWGLGSTGYYTNSDVASLTNGNKLPIVATMSCLTGGFDSVYNNGNCIGEEFLRNPNGGGIAYVGATRVAWGYTGNWITTGLAGELDWQFWNSYNLGITKPGPMLSEAKIRYIESHSPYDFYDGYGYLDEKTVLEYALLGDPVIVIPPISVTVDAPAIVEINDIFNVTAAISNSGTETATGVNATISWIPESGLSTVDALTQLVGDITGGGSKIVSWTMNADAIGIYNITVDVSATNTEPVNDTTTIEVTPPITIEFQDSFEDGTLGPEWVQDPQNDWFVSTQRATDGSHSAEVDGRAADATLTMANAIDLSEKTSATLTFSWLIESSWDAGESICLDMYYDGVWHNGVPRTASCLEGNVDAENIWHDESIDLSDYMTSDFNIRFRAKVSSSLEDGNVDNVKIISYAKPPTPDTTSPTVMLVNPEDGATDTDGNVTFEYIPDDADSGIASCELIINGNSDKNDTSIEEGVTNSFTKTGMTNGTYTWTVTCIDDSPNANGGSGIVRTLYINIDREVPEITNITGDTSTTTGDPVDIVVTATDNIDPTSAKIFIDGDATGIGMVEDPGDTFTHAYTAPTDSVASHTYYVEVYDAAENSARAPKGETETYTITVTDNDAPSTITDLRATAVAGGKINLSWSAATDNIGMVSYNVYRDTTKITNLTCLTPIKTGVTDTSYTDAATVDGTTYWYAVVGVEDAGNEGEVSNSPSATADATAPTISNVAASSITDSSATITWTTDEASDSVVRYGTDPSLGSETSDTVMVTSHSVTLTGLTAGTEYYYEIESPDAAGNTAIDNNGGAYYTFTTTAPSATANVSIEMSKQSLWKWWRVTAAVTITENNASGPPIEGVASEGYWSGAYSGTESGMTDKNGKVSFRTSWITESGEVCFTVDRVVGYDLAGETTKCINGGSSGSWRSRS